MGDTRFSQPFERVQKSGSPRDEAGMLSDEDLVAALAAASTQSHDPYLANVLATDLMNRLGQKNAILRTAGEGVFALDAEGHVIFVNPAAERMLGWDLKELRGRDMHDTVHCVDGNGQAIPREECAILGVMRSREPVRRSEEFFVRRDGSRVPVAYSAAPIVREDEVTGAVVVFQDESEERARRERILASEGLVRAMLEASLDAIVTIDTHGSVVEFNPAAERLFGYARADVVGREMAELIVPPKLRESHRRGLARYMRDGYGPVVGRRLEFPAMRSDGSEFPAEVAILRIPKDGPPMFTGYIRDLTERKAVERAREAERQQVATVLESITDASLTVDREWRFVSLGGRAEEILGRREDDVLGRVLWDEFPDAADSVFFREYTTAVREGETRHFEGYHPSLGVWFEVHAYPHPGGDLTAYFRDITERKRTEAAAAREREDLERRVAERTHALAAANEELEAFSYSVSHDLRAPLRGIEYFSHLLKEELGDRLGEDEREYVDRLEGESRRLTQLVNDLLALSQVARSDLKRTRVNVTALARSVVEELARADPTRVVRVEVAEGIEVDADERLTRIVLENLLGNAWKYTAREPDARIEVGETERAGTRFFFVRDNGAGFDPALSDRLFRPFQRLHGSSEFEGTGVGLATVARIVSRHGGLMTAEGVPGKGATFYFSL